MKVFWISSLTVVSVKYAWFLNKSEKWWLIKVFAVFASRESSTPTLNYFLAIFLFLNSLLVTHISDMLGSFSINHV